MQAVRAQQIAVSGLGILREHHRWSASGRTVQGADEDRPLRVRLCFLVGQLARVDQALDQGVAVSQLQQLAVRAQQVRAGVADVHQGQLVAGPGQHGEGGPGISEVAPGHGQLADVRNGMQRRLVQPVQ